MMYEYWAIIAYYYKLYISIFFKELGFTIINGRDSIRCASLEDVWYCQFIIRLMMEIGF